jgi:hypothetical protein
MKANELKQIIMEEIQKVLREEKKLTAAQKKLAALRPPKDKITRGDVIAAAQKNKSDKSSEEEDESLEEKKMTKSQMGKREKFVKGMKGAAKDFSKRYGSRGKDVMYATATKMAQKKKKKG